MKLSYLPILFVLALPAIAQSIPPSPNNTQTTEMSKKQLKNEEKASKAQAKADKAKRKALDTDAQKKADKEQDKADRAAAKSYPQ